jgi:hypothetical protein
VKFTLDIETTSVLEFDAEEIARNPLQLFAMVSKNATNKAGAKVI